MTASPFVPVAPQALSRVWLETASGALPAIARDIVTGIRSEVPEYGVDDDGTAAAETRLAVREALSMFMRSLAGGTIEATPDARGAEVFRRLGRREARAGRSHDTLQSAYRVASQSVMHHLLRWEHDHDAPRDVMAALSTAVFGFIDELARCSAEGYAEARDTLVDDAQARAELLTLLVQREGWSRRQVAIAAKRVGWTVPGTVTVLEIVGARGEELAPLLGPGVIIGNYGERLLAVLPCALDLDDLRASLAGTAALVVVSPVVPVAESGSAARLVQRLRVRHDVRRRAIDGVVACTDHMIDLLLDSSRDAGRALAASRLRPLAELSPSKRIKYARLLSAWLEYGTLNADEPGVLDKHRQTLRYQCAKIEKMFGDALTDRDARLEIMLALRATLPQWERQAAGSPSGAPGDATP